MNIKTKYRIPDLLNNKKTIAENNKKKRQSQGTLHAVPITRNYTKIPVTGKNTKK
jgi:hypothetical protein